ncbi:DinB family protein [Yinghuangia soli]|uniref:DinB family protein n=1 Tax=Yinghuangia soli TaxID=2908204 RepID=A0AA41Q011_9ACTN|nr:DinB family protein [Yinghuangia soli]MCF2528470.1 DinB family protein [Yinghuangia soli]
MPATPDGRTIPPFAADERTMLEAWLDFHRETLLAKCAGLDDEQLRTASAKPSPLTLLGLVQHMSEVERNWFQRVFAGRNVPHVYPDADGAGFIVVPQRGLAEAAETWRAEIALGRELAEGADLDATRPARGTDGASGRRPAEEQVFTLRWILVHLIEEYARHNGHADLLRERLDGTSGV